MTARAERRRAGCIFCGGGGMTKEHFWPRWLHQLLTTDEVSSTNLVTHFREVDGKTRREMRFDTKNGSRLTKTVRKVCGRCNGGWMSRLQEEARPIVTDLVRGVDRQLGVDAQRMLAAWICMTAMVAEYMDWMSVGTTPEERTSFSVERLPPSTWRIWIGQYDRALIEPLHLHDSFGLPPYPDNVIRLNSQSTCMAIGGLFAYAVSMPDAEMLAAHADFVDRLLPSIWPPRPTPLRWRRGSLLTDESFYWFADLVGRLISKRGPLLALPDAARPLS